MKMRLQDWKFILRAWASNRGVTALAAFTMAVGLMAVPAYAGPKGVAENSVDAMPKSVSKWKNLGPRVSSPRVRPRAIELAVKWATSGGGH